MLDYHLQLGHIKIPENNTMKKKKKKKTRIAIATQN